MKLKTKVTKETEVDIEIPFFRKDAESSGLSYLAVIEETHVVTFYDNEQSGHTIVTTSPQWVKESDILHAYYNWKPVSEEEFLTAHENALKSLSLKPMLSDSNDLKGINI